MSVVVRYPAHWTHSRLSDFEKCPLMYAGKYCRHFGEYEYKQSPAAARGDKIHLIMQESIDTGAKLTGALARYNDYVAGLRSSWPFIYTERKLGLAKDWSVVDWSGSGLWWRGKMDVECHSPKKKIGKVIDWKTGNVYGTNADQIRLYAGVMMSMYPYKQVEVELVYLDQRQSIIETITRKEWDAFRSDFEKRAGAMLSARRFPAKPGTACNWCDFSPAKGGPCTKGAGTGKPVPSSSRGPRAVAEKIAPLRKRRP